MKTTTLQVKIVMIVVVFIVIAAVFHVGFRSTGYNENHSRNFHILTESAGPWQQQLVDANNLTLPPISNDALVRAVYFDNRPRNGHKKIGVFLVALREVVFTSNLVTACGVGKEMSTNFRLRALEENRLMHNWVYVIKKSPHFAYEEFIIECYDLLHMSNGSKAFILFKNERNSPVYAAISEFPLMFPAPKVQPIAAGKYDFSVVTCTEAHNKRVTWLPQFVRYQKTIGVDHVHINILDTYIKDGGLAGLLEDPQVAKGVADGYVTMTVWKDILESSNQVYSYSAILRKLDCVYRFQGTYDYAFLLDSDDFFNPMLHGRTHVKDYIQNWCRSDKSAGSCYFTWWFYYPQACGMKDEKVEDGNITRLLKSYKRTNNNHFKSVHLISAVVDTGYHNAICRECLLPGYRAIHINDHVAYVAHLRMYTSPPGGCN